MAFYPNFFNLFSIALISQLFAVLFALSAFFLTWRIFFHPLSGYPGPFLAKFSQFYTFYSVYHQNRTVYQYRLLQKYGSPVRISTNELLFSDLKSWADIYGQSSQPCLKDPALYDAFTVTGAENLLSVTGRGDHARLRRLLSHTFSTKSLLQSESVIAAKVNEFVDVVLQGQVGKTLEIYTKIHELYLDIVSQLSFGKSLDCLSGRNPTAHNDVKGFTTIIPAVAFFPLIQWLPSHYIREGYRGLARLEKFSRENVAEYLYLSKGTENAGQRGGLLQNLAIAKDDETGTALSQEEIVEHAILFLVAGSDTTAITTTYLLWECGRRREVRERLADEIRTKFPDPQVMPTFEEASQLEYLNCVVQETLRLWGPLSVPLPRISPGKMIGSRFVPKGVIVSTNPYATARSALHFPNPEKFDPSRWELSTPDMRNMSRPFSYGPRNCIGKNLAEIGLLLTVARLYQLFDIVTDANMKEDEMEMVDIGALEPRGKSLFVNVNTFVSAGALS